MDASQCIVSSHADGALEGWLELNRAEADHMLHMRVVISHGSLPFIICSSSFHVNLVPALYLFDWKFDHTSL